MVTAAARVARRGRAPRRGRVTHASCCAYAAPDVTRACLVAALNHLPEERCCLQIHSILPGQATTWVAVWLKLLPGKESCGPPESFHGD